MQFDHVADYYQRWGMHLGPAHQCRQVGEVAGEDPLPGGGPLFHQRSGCGSGEAMGHKLQPLEDRYGTMQAVYWNCRSGRVTAVSDPRGIGAAVVRQASSLRPGS